MQILKEQRNNKDQEEAHMKADMALLNFIFDEEVLKAYDKIPKWYA